MYLGRTFTGQAMRQYAAEAEPFGAGFDPQQVAEADRLEIWHSAFSDPGPDFNEFRLFRGETLMGVRRTEGY